MTMTGWIPAFDKRDNAKLKNEKKLNDPGKYLESSQFGLAIIAGYTDLKGDSEKDRLLTQARAMVVREYLGEEFRIARHENQDDRRSNKCFMNAAVISMMNSTSSSITALSCFT